MNRLNAQTGTHVRRGQPGIGSISQNREGYAGPGHRRLVFVSSQGGGVRVFFRCVHVWVWVRPDARCTCRR